jgi:hypothetical protein
MTYAYKIGEVRLHSLLDLNCTRYESQFVSTMSKEVLTNLGTIKCIVGFKYRYMLVINQISAHYGISLGKAN